MKSSNQSNQNFWISYADLMAGLLFIFILLIGAIVIKYVFLQSNLKTQSDELERKQKAMLSISSELITTQDALKAIKILLSEEEEKNKKSTSLILEKDKTISQNQEELKTIKRLLLEEEEKNKKSTSLILEKDKTISQNQEELKSAKSSLMETKKSLTLEQNRSQELKTKLNESANQISLTKVELNKIAQKLLETTLAHQKLVEDLNITKARIKNLTGIRIQAIKSLKSKLGKNIQIDPNSGSIRLSSSVLFDRGSDILKPEAKKALKDTVLRYINTLLNDQNIKGYIENIIIEGHTDTDGSYMFNLDLSQKRAFAVLDYLYKQNGVNQKLFRKYVSASGKSYSNIITKNNQEDKEASRRIEVKFSISNKKAMQEIEDFLTGDYK